MKRLLVIVSVLFGLMQAAHADDFQPYVGGALGLGVLNTNVNGVGDTGSSLIGYGSLGFLYNNIAGAEVRLGATSSYNFASGSVNLNARTNWLISYLARVQFSLSDQFDFYALLGGTTAKKTLNITTPGFIFLATGTPTYSWTRTTVSSGIGLEYHNTSQLDIGTEIMTYGDGLSSFTANLRYSF